MSRVGLKPIPVPSGVEVKVADRNVSVEGPLGRLEWRLEPGLSVASVNGNVLVRRASDDRKIRSLHGLTRAEIQNMVEGVTKGYEKILEVTGV